MKSVGEVMGIGRSFTEALQKAVRMVSEDDGGLSAGGVTLSDDPVKSLFFDEMKQATDTRLFKIVDALREDVSIDEIYKLTHIDMWFLNQLSQIITLENEVAALARIQSKVQRQAQSQNLGYATDFLREVFSSVSPTQLRSWKAHGFGDEQLATIALRELFLEKKKLTKFEINQAMLVIRKIRQDKQVLPVRKKIDTSAAEFPSRSNYLYMTYNGDKNDALEPDTKTRSALALGSGAYRIGSSVEFDWCLVSCLEELRDSGWRSVVINCNPETVSTDHDASDLLYFEELSVERILDIIDLERIDGTIVAMGGQLPNRLSPILAQLGVNLLGHKWGSIDQAEDREKFSGLLDKLDIGQPRWVEATSVAAVAKFTEEVGFPVLIRPSYVLSGAAMSVAVDQESLTYFLSRAKAISEEHPVILTRYFEDALEVELDGVSQKGQVLASMISSHVEKAGIHSGDATLVFPARGLSAGVEKQVSEIGARLSQALELNGPFNLQFLVENDKALVIECNVRASRSFPFVSKLSEINLARLATRVMVDPQEQTPLTVAKDLGRVGVKASMFSFQRLLGADPVLGVEMASTGEVACVAKRFEEALVLAFEAVSNRRPKIGALLSGGRSREKHKLIPAVESLVKLNVPIFATEGTANFLTSQGFAVKKLSWNEIEKQVIGLIKEDQIDFIINLPKNYSHTELENGYLIRTAAIRHGCTLLTNIEKANTFLQALSDESAQVVVAL